MEVGWLAAVVLLPPEGCSLQDFHTASACVSSPHAEQVILSHFIFYNWHVFIYNHDYSKR